MLFGNVRICEENFRNNYYMDIEAGFNKIQSLSRKEMAIGVAGFGRVGSSISEYFTKIGFKHFIYNRTLPTEEYPEIRFMDSIDALFNECNILINTLPRDAFFEKFHGNRFKGDHLFSYTLDLTISEIDSYCSSNTDIQRIISSTAIKSGQSIILSTPSSSNLLKEIFPFANIIFINEELLLLGTMLLSSSALSGLVISTIYNNVILKGIPHDLAKLISNSIPNELELLKDCWGNDLSKVYSVSAVKGGITESLGKGIIDVLEDSIIKLIERKTEND